jgi:hypothetical protein
MEIKLAHPEVLPDPNPSASFVCPFFSALWWQMKDWAHKSRTNERLRLHHTTFLCTFNLLLESPCVQISILFPFFWRRGWIWLYSHGAPKLQACVHPYRGLFVRWGLNRKKKKKLWYIQFIYVPPPLRNPITLPTKASPEGSVQKRRKGRAIFALVRPFCEQEPARSQCSYNSKSPSTSQVMNWLSSLSS